MHNFRRSKPRHGEACGPTQLRRGPFARRVEHPPPAGILPGNVAPGADACGIVSLSDGGSRPYTSRPSAGLAQLVEHLIRNKGVGSENFSQANIVRAIWV